MDIFTIGLYVIGGLLLIIGWFLKDKVSKSEAIVEALRIKIDEHIEDDNTLHLKILESYVTKAEYMETINRLFNILQVISQDVKNLISTKADR